MLFINGDHVRCGDCGRCLGLCLRVGLASNRGYLFGLHLFRYGSWPANFSPCYDNRPGGVGAPCIFRSRARVSGSRHDVWSGLPMDLLGFCPYYLSADVPRLRAHHPNIPEHVISPPVSSAANLFIDYRPRTLREIDELPQMPRGRFAFR